MKPSVCVDLDGTLITYDKWRGLDHFGDPIKGSQRFTHLLSKFARVVIFTTRTKLKPEYEEQGLTINDLVSRVSSFLDEHGYYYDEIYSGQGKPLAVAYVDDRAIPCQPQLYESEFHVALRLAKELCKEAKLKD